MDGSDNKSLSSTPNRRLSFSKGTDENDQNYQGWGLNVQNPKKPLTTTATKHFMSSTISAASKVPALDLVNMRKMLFFLDHPSSRPYDPLTNYISPRPTFLRYKPHRLRDIFLRRENEAREESSSCCGGSLESNNDKDVEDELGTSSLADGTQEDDVEKEGVDENEEEFEEVEEDRCWSLKGVLKYFAFVGCFGAF
ncbi:TRANSMEMBRANE PROTEIN [Salix purpurea]|uniref:TRANSMEMBRANE PROTEIN n=1 Tax=Salix purpurea TaxID=77065 RepID=A0A9Q0YVL1_SALPP|nr:TRANSMEMBRANE PROTEIN [Salix purpurea]